MNFRERLKQPRPLIIDGAMGTLIFQRVPGYGSALELLNHERPEIIQAIHEDYFNAGADIVETNTFGASRLKLSEYGLEARCAELNEKGALAAKKAAEKSGGFVAGSMGPCGALIKPAGDFSPEAVYESFAEQVRGLARGGADLIAIETMTDIQEARLALLAAKENCGLPVLCSMTFEENGKTVTGTGMAPAFFTLAAMGADILGANCSQGPEGLLKIFLDAMPSLQGLGAHLSVWSNAGLPEMIDDKLTYRLTPDKFAEASAGFAKAGVKIIGGCCGTNPQHIEALSKTVKKLNITGSEPGLSAGRQSFAVTSRSGILKAESAPGLIVIGERLNPSARKAFAADLKEGSTRYLRSEAKAQAEEGASLLDINVGLSGIDEAESAEKCVSILSGTTALPLMIDSDNPQVIERALWVYPGVPVINSVNGKEKSLRALTPIIKRFGASAVALCLDESGVHREAEKRISAGEKLIAALNAEGISTDRLFVDPLILAESAEPGAAVETLKVISHFSSKGIKTSIGLSNISFGLPERKHINAAFLKLAVEAGLTAAIMNPAAKTGSDPEAENLAKEFLLGRDPGAANYIAYFKSKQPAAPSASAADAPALSTLEKIRESVIEGSADEVPGLIQKALDEKTDAADIMDRALISGLERVGELYSTGEYFLPQMISSAGAMKAGFLILKPLLASGSDRSLGKVVICTVRGDIHDIGKNIVSMMLENHGFQVFDLGKDVPAEKIIEEALRVDADIIALSSLLTTTMNEMKAISGLIKEKGVRASLLVGGAVVTEEYAASIGAHYGRDAVEGVAAAKKLVRAAE